MLDIEKMAAKARNVLMTISLIGILVLATGVALTVVVMINTQLKSGVNRVTERTAQPVRCCAAGR